MLIISLILKIKVASSVIPTASVGNQDGFLYSQIVWYAQSL